MVRIYNGITDGFGFSQDCITQAGLSIVSDPSVQYHDDELISMDGEKHTSTSDFYMLSTAEANRFLSERDDSEVIMTLFNGKCILHEDNVIGIVVDNGDVITRVIGGIAVYRTFDDYVCIQALYIVPEYRKQGYGSLLVAHVLNVLSENHDQIYIDIRSQRMEMLIRRLPAVLKSMLVIHRDESYDIDVYARQEEEQVDE